MTLILFICRKGDQISRFKKATPQLIMYNVYFSFKFKQKCLTELIESVEWLQY